MQAVTSINTLLEKADRLYKHLQLNKPALEGLLIKISEHGGDRSQVRVRGREISLSDSRLPSCQFGILHGCSPEGILNRSH